MISVFSDKVSTLVQVWKVQRQWSHCNVYLQRSLRNVDGCVDRQRCNRETYPVMHKHTSITSPEFDHPLNYSHIPPATIHNLQLCGDLHQIKNKATPFTFAKVMDGMVSKIPYSVRCR